MVNIKEKFLFRETDGNILYYSERGIMGYFYATISQSKGPDILRKYLNVDDIAKEKVNKLDKLLIIGEIDLGKRDGFGCPDGIIFGLDKDGKPNLLMFIEAKITTYLNSVKSKYDNSGEGKIIINRDGYNSTIKGQIELKYRFLRALFSRPNEKEYLVTERPGVAKNYKKYDIKYEDIDDNSLRNEEKLRRHLKMENGLKYVLTKINLLTSKDNTKSFKNLITRTLFVIATNERNLNSHQIFIQKYQDILPEFLGENHDYGDMHSRIAYLDINRFINDQKNAGSIEVP